MRKLIIPALLLMLLAAGALTWPYIQAFQTTGNAAVQVMTSEERAYMSQRLMAIPRGATRSQVEAVLGAPYRNQSTERPSWYGPTQDSRVDVYFERGSAFKIRWLRVGRIGGTGFLWEKNINR